MGEGLPVSSRGAAAAERIAGLDRAAPESAAVREEVAARKLRVHLDS